MAIYGTPLLMGGSGGKNDTLPPLLDNFTASRDGETITITASKLESSRAEHLAGAVWVYADHIPQKVSDGTKIELTRDEIVGSSDEVITKTIQWGAETECYIRQFTYNEKKQYQTMLDGAVASPSFKPKGQPISNLASRSTLKLGSWNGTPLKWTVCRDTQDQSVRLVLTAESVNVLGNKQFDAPEPNNSNSDRRSYGNNRYIWSNIHQWLNSTKGANQWYTAQHGADAPPDYQNQVGFLNGWATNELDALEFADWMVTKSSVDGGGSESFKSRITLLSTTDLNFENGTGGRRLDIFNSDSDRTIGREYWCRNPYPSYAYYVRYVGSSGSLHNLNSASISSGVRTLCKPLSNTLVSIETDSEGCFTLI